MAKAQRINFTSQAGGSAGTTQFYVIGSSDCFGGTTEATKQTKFISPGILSNLWFRIRTNATTAASTAKSRINTANGTQTITITLGTTGVFTDATHTDTVASNDLIAATNVIGAGGSCSPSIVAMIFDATTNTISSLIYQYFQTAVATASTSFFIPISGCNNSSNNTTTEANTKVRQRKAGTFQNATIDIGTNTRAQASTFTSRKNGAPGTITKSITGNTAGLFTDSVNTDAVVAGDDYNLSITTGTSTGNNNIDTTFIEFLSSAGDVINVIADHTQITQLISVTRAYGLGGAIAPATLAELDAEAIAGVAYTYSELTINLITNTVSAASTLTFRAGAANVGSISVAITASTAGVYSDSVNTYVASAADLVNSLLVTGGTGTSMKANMIAVWGTASAAGGVSARPRTQAINMSPYLTMNLGPYMTYGVGNQGGINI